MNQINFVAISLFFLLIISSTNYSFAESIEYTKVNSSSDLAYIIKGVTSTGGIDNISHDGSGQQLTTGNVHVDVDSVKNTGIIEIQWVDLDGNDWRLVQTEFGNDPKTFEMMVIDSKLSSDPIVSNYFKENPSLFSYIQTRGMADFWKNDTFEGQFEVLLYVGDGLRNEQTGIVLGDDKLSPFNPEIHKSMYTNPNEIMLHVLFFSPPLEEMTNNIPPMFDDFTHLVFYDLDVEPQPAHIAKISMQSERKSPLQQMKAGILPQDVMCNDDKILMLRTSDASAICLKQKSVSLFEERDIAYRSQISTLDISADFPFESQYVDILGSKMHYIDEGEGDPVLFLHGNPTSSYLWRNIIPYVSDDGRVIAVDLIGMGKSDKPDIDYRFVDHAKYLDAFIEELELKNVTLVIHDWGSALGFNYAMHNEDNIKGIAFMEPLLMPLTWDKFPAEYRETFQMFRTPGIGEDMIMTQNVFVEQMLPGATLRELTDEEMNQYREPYPTVESRKPVWVWANEVPLDGEPADVHKIVADYNQWLQETEIPKILFYVNPGAIMPAPMVEWSEVNLKNLETVYVGEGIHFIQEDHPNEIGQGLADWYQKIS